MKKLIGITLISTLLVACGDKDEAYFLENPEKAKATLTQCENDLLEAAMKDDEKAFEKIEANPECLAADQAIKKQRVLDREKAEAAKLAAIEAEREKIAETNKNNTWQQNITAYLNVDCKTGFLQDPTPECAGWKSFYNDEFEKGRAILVQAPFEELKTQSKEYCSLDQRQGSVCAVWQTALADKGAEELQGLDIYQIEAKKAEFCSPELKNLNLCRKSWKDAWDIKNKELTQHYVQNDVEFVETYNACVDQFQAVKGQDLKLNDQYNAMSAIEESAPCAQAKNAYRERGMGYDRLSTKIATP